MAQTASTLRGHERILDYGCGSMPYRPLFEERGITYVGADLAGPPGATLVLNAYGSIPIAPESFDLVISSQVLEHATDPSFYLAEARRVLRPSGTLVLSTHGYWRYHPHPDDYWRWTASGLKRTLITNGFEIDSFQGIMGPLAAATQLWQDAMITIVPRPLRRLFTGLVQTLIVAGEALLGNEKSGEDACVYFVVARKRQSIVDGA